MTKPLCRKCLLSDMDFSDTYNDIKRLIDLIPAGEKASDEEYSKRLSLCRQCTELLEGTCRVCGCYVELRAVKKDIHCPGRNMEW